MKKILFSLFLISVTLVLRAQNSFWEEAKGPYGGDIPIIQTNTNVIYAQGANFVYRSDDFGEHWERIFVPAVDSLETTGEALFIGTSGIFYKVVSYYNGSSNYPRKLFVSSNEGQSWSLLNNAPTTIQSVYEAPSGVLIGADGTNRKIFRSIDDGTSWTQVFTSSSTGLLSGYKSSATTAGKILFSEQYNNDFAYSEDNGLTWVEGESPWYQSNSFLAYSGTLFATNFGTFQVKNALCRSTDAGITWDTIPFNSSPYITLNNIINLNNGKLLLSSNDNLYVSEDDGLSWNPLPITSEQASGFSLTAPLSNGVLLGIHREALVRSSDEGGTWSFSAFGMQDALIYGLKIPNALEQLALTKSGVWKSSDRGETWDRILADSSPTTLFFRRSIALITKDSFAVILGEKLWGTTDGGQSFSDLTPAGGLSNGEVLASPSGHLFCTGVSGTLKMVGVGNSWSLSVPEEYFFQLVEHPSGDLYAISTKLDNSSGNITLRRSHDKGDTWEEVTSLAIPPLDRMDLQIDPNGKLYVMGYHEHAAKVAISEDGAESWEYKTIPDLITTGTMVVNDHGQLFVISASSSNYRILTSADGGDSWYYLPEFPDGTELYIPESLLSADGYLYYPRSDGILLRTKNPTQFGAFVRGEVDRDADMDCSTPDAQEPLKNWIIELEGENNYYAITNELGRYTFLADTGSYTVKAVAPQILWWSLCDSSQVIEANELMNSDTVNFVALPLANCPLMSVNVAIPQLRRCFNNEIYVDYCNQGTETADSAWVDIILDPYLSFISSVQPHELLSGDTIRFFIGDMTSGDCGQFQLTVYANCDSTILGQTHCVTAHAFPDTLCTTITNWSGANIEASVTCQDTMLQFNLKNTGNAHSQTLDYIIIEDEVVLMTGQKDYDISEDVILNFPANGSTWRIESAQEPGHPFSTLALAFAEGCGGFSSLGFINLFPVNGFKPSLHRSCAENIGSFDPNDKQGFPTGVGDDHNIRPGQAIDYLIRFQNTGTDTAFTVQIQDTLSAFLDPTTIRLGGSSHAFTWNLSGQGVINFTFNNIMLPDSNMNEPLSHGFVQFNISPYSTLPLGSRIENDAAIYFDFNEPVITNTTWHTIQNSPQTSSLWPEPKKAAAGLEVWPNPFSERTNIRLEKKTSGTVLLKIYDSRGTSVAEITTIGPDIELNIKHLPTGMYWAELRDMQGRLLGNGKLVIE